MNGVMTLVVCTGWELSRSVPQTRTSLGRRLGLASDGWKLGWSNGVANGVGILVGQCHGREGRWDAGNSVGLLVSGRGLIGVGA